MAHDADVLRGLLERVKAAEGPSYALECAIGRTFEGINPSHRTPPNYTVSVDTGLALASRILPKWSLRLGLSEGYRHPCVVMGRSYPTNKMISVEHRTAPLAICAAILTAVLDQHSLTRNEGGGDA